MPRYITLSPALYEHLRREAALNDRTIKAQALHWLAIGKALEASDLYTHSELTALLERFEADTRPE
ncbi:TA system antitoxin ParD family protein [Shimia sp.]|uniref:TA system antitoxin ParD family protein n=1 Tax=Shimia sp. TaxID=1954381 RepID=UPI003B8CF828